MRNESIDAVGSDGVGLRLEFRWLGDRYGHFISQIGPTKDAELILESIEGAPPVAWPPSPPFQSLTLQNLANGASAALLVGMAGRSHWSASIEAVPNRAELLFDIACRHSEWLGWLGSQYRLLSPTDRNCRIRGIECEVQQKPESLLIQPASTTIPAQTARWRYGVSMENT
jgi:hypothetical protein